MAEKVYQTFCTAKNGKKLRFFDNRGQMIFSGRFAIKKARKNTGEKNAFFMFSMGAPWVRF